MRSVGSDDGRVIGIDVDREQHMERAGGLNVREQVTREVLVVGIRFDQLIPICRRQDFVPRDVPGAAGCYAVTRTLSCKNSGAKSAPFAQTSVWNSG